VVVIARTDKALEVVSRAIEDGRLEKIDIEEERVVSILESLYGGGS